MRIGALAGAVPSKLILPATVAAEAGSTVTAGAAAGSEVVGAGAGWLPPHAATPKLSTSSTARCLRCIEILLDVETKPNDARGMLHESWYRYGDSNPGPVAENHVS